MALADPVGRPVPDKSAKDNPARRPAAKPAPAKEAGYQPVSLHLAIAPTVSIIIPALNEARSLPHVLESLPSWAQEVVLVDGRSTDDTIAVARKFRTDIKVVTQPGIGKGDALLAGFAASSGDIIVTVDGDGSTDGSEVVQFVSALAAGADFAKGSRFATGGSSDDLTRGRRYGNRLLKMLVNLMFGTTYTDLCYGYNAFWARHLRSLSLNCSGFEIETVMNIRAAKAGLRIQEIPSHERPRVHGSSHLRVIGDGWRILKAILREKFGAPQ